MGVAHGLMDLAVASNSTDNSTENSTDNSTGGDDMISGSASISLGPFAAACVAVLFLANVAAASNNSTGNSTGDDMISGSGTAWLGSLVASCAVAALLMWQN